MKPKSQPAQPSTATVDDLQRQRAELLRAQTEAHGRLDTADPLDWRAVSTANGDLVAIGSALTALDRKLEVARGDLARATSAERDAAIQAQRQAAVKKARTATVAAVDVLRHLDAGVFAELDLAAIELQRAGAYPTGPTATIATLRQQVTLALSRIKAIDPELLGLPPHPTAQEIAIHDARSRLAAAEKRLADLSESTTRGSRWQDLVTEAEARVKTCQAKVTDLTGESFALANLGAKIKIANLARYIDPPQANPSEVVT